MILSARGRAYTITHKLTAICVKDVVGHLYSGVGSYTAQSTAKKKQQEVIHRRPIHHESSSSYLQTHPLEQSRDQQPTRPRTHSQHLSIVHIQPPINKFSQTEYVMRNTVHTSNIHNLLPTILSPICRYPPTLSLPRLHIGT